MRTNGPTVTVVIVAKRAEKTIGSLFESLERQTYRPKETILVIDSLDDPTVDIASSFQAKIVESRVGGIGAARFEGVEAATGDIIAFTDSDCVADDHWLEAFALGFHHRKDILAQAGRTVDRESELEVVDFATGLNPEMDGWVDFAETQNICFKRSLFEIVGNFDPDFAQGGEDLDFCMRVKKKGYRIHTNSSAVVLHLRHEGWAKTAWRDGKSTAKNFLKHGRILIGAATVKLGNSICLLTSLVLLGFGMYVMALLVFSPSIIHRTYRALIKLKRGLGFRYVFNTIVLGYVSSISFLVFILPLALRPSSKSKGSGRSGSTS